MTATELVEAFEREARSLGVISESNGTPVWNVSENRRPPIVPTWPRLIAERAAREAVAAERARIIEALPWPQAYYDGMTQSDLALIEQIVNDALPPDSTQRRA